MKKSVPEAKQQVFEKSAFTLLPSYSFAAVLELCFLPSASMSCQVDADCNVKLNANCPALRLDYLREVVNGLIDKQEFKSAAFWADKVVCLSDGDTRDVFVQAKCLFHLKEYHRAMHCIKAKNLQASDLACRHLMAKCHVSFFNVSF